MPTFSPKSVIALDTSNAVGQTFYGPTNLPYPYGFTKGTPLYYAVAQGGGYTRDWQRYFSSQPLPFGLGRINGIDNGPGINQYTIIINVTTWPSTSQPYKQGVTTTWDVQKYNLEASFQKVATPLLFLDPFNNPPYLDPTTGVYFWKFSESLLPQSTPQLPFIQYEITLTQSPPGYTF